jgi:hypothetical protein
VRSHPTAGQAALEYIAALALVATLFLFAAPAVGAPDIAGSVARAIEHGLCIVGGDVCTSADARREGLPPCPLKSDTTGWEVSGSAMIVDLGGKFTLTVTPQSDGSVSVVRAAAGTKGLSDGAKFELHAGPVQIDVGVDGTIAKRIQGAVGWEFPDLATAERFLEHSVRNTLDLKRWPPTWHSTENASEIAAMAGLKLGGSDRSEHYDLVGVSAFAQFAEGARRGRDGSVTLYSRTTFDGPEVTLPGLPSVGRGRNDAIVEYTVGPDGRPRELAFRTAWPDRRGNQVTETVRRLNLRDPENLAAARPLLEHRLPWPPGNGPRKQAVLQQIAERGSTETSVYAVEDDSKGASGALKGGLELGLGVKHISVHRTLLRASARRGALVGRRLDCAVRTR